MRRRTPAQRHPQPRFAEGLQRIDTLRRYVILEHNSVGLTVFARRQADEEWTATALTSEDVLELPEIAVEIPVAELYENVDLAENEFASAVAQPDQQLPR